MIIVFSSFVVLGSVMMVAFSEYTKNDKRKILTQSATSMASITASMVAEEDNGSAVSSFLLLFVKSFSLNIDADIFVTDLDGNVILGAFANSTDRVGKQFVPFKSVPKEAVERAAAGTFTGNGKRNGICEDPYYVVGVPLATSAEDKDAVRRGVRRDEYRLAHRIPVRNLSDVPDRGGRGVPLPFCIVGLFAYRLVKPLRRYPPRPEALARAISRCASRSPRATRSASSRFPSTPWPIRSRTAKA